MLTGGPIEEEKIAEVKEDQEVNMNFDPNEPLDGES